MDLFSAAARQNGEERIKTVQEIWKILIDQQYAVGTVGHSPAPMGVPGERPPGQRARLQLHRPALPPAGAHLET